MIVVNFSHPLTDAQLSAIAQLSGYAVERVVDQPVHFDEQRGYAEQAHELIDDVELSGQQWQTEPLLVNLPGHSAIAAVILAELHGRMGHFPTIVRLRADPRSALGTFEVVELIRMHAIRNTARGLRFAET